MDKILVNPLPAQLALRLTKSRPLSRLEDYIEADGHHVVEQIRHFLQSTDEVAFYVSGCLASGKTHLLLGATQTFPEGKAVYLNLSEMTETPTAILDGVEEMSLVCLDNIEAMVGNTLWQRALFHLFNRCHTTGCKMMVSGLESPNNTDLELPDLKSRLSWGIVLRLPTLNEIQRIEVLDMQAHYFGIKLTDEVKLYILKRAPRDLNSLTDLLYQLEQASLQQKRAITIPFIKSIMSW